MTNKAVLATLLLSIALAACGDKKKDDAAPKSTDQAAAPKKGAVDFAAIQTVIDAAKVTDDFDPVFEKCMGALIDLGLSGVKEPDKDPAYRATCKVAVARKRAALVIADSTPDKMNTMCITSSMELDELGGAGGPEADEMKQLMADVDKACGL